MVSVQTVTLVASILTTIGPAMQLWHVLRTKSAKGLSAPTFFMLTLASMMTLLLGVQYQIGLALALSFASLAFQLATLALINRALAFGLAAAGLLFAASIAFGPQAYATAITGTTYSEVVAFVWGALFAVTFVPQVIMTRRTRETHNLAMSNLVISGAGTFLWAVFAVMVANYSMTFWLCIVLIALAELIRLKLVEKPKGIAVAD